MRRYLEAQAPAFLQDLRTFVRFPSVSADPARAEAMRGCARWLAGRLERAGLEHVRRVDAGGPPLVLADWLHAAGRPTVLIYGHYDVQPEGPASAWSRPAFCGDVSGGFLHGRGSADDKGQIFAHVMALQALLSVTGRLPVNVRCLFEGEEEIGSEHLRPWLDRHLADVRADVVVISDTPMRARNRPALTESLRGLYNVEIGLARGGEELHAGQFGGAVTDPVAALARLIAGLDRDGRVQIPGFYDDVRTLSPAHRRALALAAPSDRELLASAGHSPPCGEPGFSAFERTTIRPALTVTGLAGGYLGAGSKNAIATHAKARLSFRLVPDQDPVRVQRALVSHLAGAVPRGCRLVVRPQAAVRPVAIARGAPALAHAAAAFETGFGRTPVWLRAGGTVPAVSWLHELLRAPIALMGFASPDDRMHAPNERMSLGAIFAGALTSADYLTRLATTQRLAT